MTMMQSELYFALAARALSSGAPAESKNMPATNGIIFVGIFFTVAIGCLFGAMGLGWI